MSRVWEEKVWERRSHAFTRKKSTADRPTEDETNIKITERVIDATLTWKRWSSTPLPTCLPISLRRFSDDLSRVPVNVWAGCQNGLNFIDCMVGWLTDLLTYLLTDCLTDWLTYWLTYWLTDCLMLLTCLLPYLLTYLLTCLLTYLLIDWLTYLLTYLLAYFLTCLLTYWLICLLTYSFTDWPRWLLLYSVLFIHWLALIDSPLHAHTDCFVVWLHTCDCWFTDLLICWSIDWLTS